MIFSGGWPVSGANISEVGSHHVVLSDFLPAKTDNTKRDPENTSPIIAYLKPNVFMVFILAFIEVYRWGGAPQWNISFRPPPLRGGWLCIYIRKAARDMEGRPLFFPILLRADAGVTLTCALADVLSHTFPRQRRNFYVTLVFGSVKSLNLNSFSGVNACSCRPGIFPRICDADIGEKSRRRSKDYPLPHRLSIDYP